MKTFLSFLTCIVALSLAMAPVSAQETLQLVVSAPGYPGTTDGAQPTMDQFATAISASTGWDATAIRARYDNDGKSGIEQIQNGAGLALVPLPFYLEHARQLKLKPLLTAQQGNQAGQRWSLIAAKGKIGTPQDLSGWAVGGVPAYSKRFVRGPLLGEWKLPPDTTVSFNKNPLSLLRKAAKGDPVAILIDEAQAKALEKLSFAEDLETIAQSQPLPMALLCTVGDRVTDEQRDQLVRGFSALHLASGGEAELLSLMQITKFVPVDMAQLEKIQQQFAAAR